MSDLAQQNLIVMVVDDEELMTGFIEKVLEKAGYQVLSFTSPELALKALESASDVAVLITDVHMVEMDGLELMEEAMALSPALVPIVITGDKDVSLAVDSIRRGACDFLPKPLELAKLTESVANAVSLYIDRLRGDAGECPDEMRVSGKVIGDYTILDIIDQGACGTVYRAQKKNNPHVYAIKVMRGLPDEENHNRRTQRFINEGKALRQIAHPNVVQIIENGVFYEQSLQYPYIVMECFHGKKLATYLKDAVALELEQKIKIIKQLASGLHAVHEKNIYHRDIKPENVLVSKSLHAVIVDFGVCHLPLSDITLSGSLIGTPCYLSPEQLQEGITSRLSDIYALGIIAYELFMGIKPFNHDLFHRLVYKIVHEYPIEPRSLNPDFPLELQNILAKMIHKNPKKRYQDGLEIVDDFDRFLSHTRHNSFYHKLKHVVIFQKHWA